MSRCENCGAFQCNKPSGKVGKCEREVYGKVGTNARQGVGYPLSILSFPKPNNLSGGNLHPTQKPVALGEYLIRTYTNEGETVLDNTMGAGSFGVSAVNTNRSFIGIEKDAGYFEIAKRRIEEAQSKARQLELAI